MNKIQNVKEILKDEKIAIAFSGGADSTLMAYLASQVCENPLAITINNHIMPEGFIEHTKEVCKDFGIKQEIIDVNFYENEEIINNPPNRCYCCRDEMYKLIVEAANNKGYFTIVDGTNISDLVADRPGILINYKNNIKSPFVEGHLTSKDIHKYLYEKNIPYSKSTTCLATRLPFNTNLTPEKLENIDLYEKIIYENTNCEIAKVREFESMHIVEVDNFEDILNENTLKSIYEKLKEAGCKKVCLNISKIDDDEEIILDYKNNNFIYKLPYNIDMDKTKIKNEKINVKEDGMIIGNGFNSYEEALEEFMNILPAIRRTVP